MEIESYRQSTPHGELVLKLRGGRDPWAALLLEGTILMDSESRVSERALARDGLERLRAARPVGGRGGYRVLLAGLGLGITLRELLAARDVDFVRVVEIFPAIVDWNRGPLARLNEDALADPRVACRAADLREVLAADDWTADPRAATYDLMLFDIDNGPAWLSLPQNAWLYGRSGLAATRRRLAIGGLAAYWAAERDVAFETNLAAVPGCRWQREPLPWQTPRGDRTLVYHLYWLARER